MISQKSRFWLTTIFLLMMVSPVLAQFRPVMNVYVNWTPDTTLSSSGADEHYVDAEFYVDGNVQFWAVEIQCNFGNGTQLIFENTTDLVFSDPWSTDGSFVQTGTADTTQAENSVGRYYDSRGLFGFTASRVGVTSLPMGVNGSDYTLLVARARFKVADLIVNTPVQAICRVMNFLDRDGNIAVRGRQTRINGLQVFVGYTLSGSVLRQGTRTHVNTQVTCTFDPDGAATPVYTTMTDIRGNFRFGGATQITQPNLLRDYGLYLCEFQSHLDGVSPDNAILTGQTYFSLNSPSMSLLPIILRSGDFDNSNLIDLSDIALVTSNFNNIGFTPLTNGDANADGRVDAADLAIVTGNDDFTDPNPSDHMIFSMGRDFDARAIFPNSKIWWGTPTSGQVYSLVLRSLTRDFWATLSPDGLEIAYVSVNARTGQHTLAFGTVAGGRGIPIRPPRTFTDHMLAPSWSPDGNRLAFICTPDDVAGNNGLRYNEGDICIVNREDRTLATLFNLGVDARIFPPTWMPYGPNDNDYLIIYGATDGTVRYFDLAQQTQGVVPLYDDGAGADNIYDMPIFQRNIRTGTNYIAYRYNLDGSSDPYIRIGTLFYDGTNFSGAATGLVDGSAHFALNGTADTTGVDFYDVSPQLDIVFYHSYNYIIANPGLASALDAYFTVDSNGGFVSAPIVHYADGFIGNPVTETINGGIWSGSYNVPTMLHAQRATIDWVP